MPLHIDQAERESYGKVCRQGESKQRRFLGSHRLLKVDCEMEFILLNSLLTANTSVLVLTLRDSVIKILIDHFTSSPRQGKRVINIFTVFLTRYCIKGQLHGKSVIQAANLHCKATMSFLVKCLKIFLVILVITERIRTNSLRARATTRQQF